MIHQFSFLSSCFVPRFRKQVALHREKDDEKQNVEKYTEIISGRGWAVGI